MSGKKEITILCYGDSNTHGTKPDRSGRYPRSVRWTGRLQKLLGQVYYVIEEGLGGRATNLEHPIAGRPTRNGLLYFKPCLESHSPVDIVVIMLGTNDHKIVYNRLAKETAEIIRQYCDFIHANNHSSKIILVAPACLKAVQPYEYYDENSEKKSKDLILELKKVADETEAYFYDANNTVSVGEDGLHWTEDSEARFAKAIAEIVERIV